MNEYLAGLTLPAVRACALEAELLFQRNPDVVPARTAAAWGRLAEVLESASAKSVAELGPEAIRMWASELGFSQTGTTWADDWPRNRATVDDVDRFPKDER